MLAAYGGSGDCSDKGRRAERLAGPRSSGHHGRMLGAAIIVVVLVVAIPVAVLMSGAAGAAILGWLVKTDVDATHEGSELLDLEL
jgi:hypothetical protein